MSFELSRRQNADLYGPTTGDAVRLGDTDLFAEIERRCPQVEIVRRASVSKSR